MSKPHAPRPALRVEPLEDRQLLHGALAHFGPGQHDFHGGPPCGGPDFGGPPAQFRPTSFPPAPAQSVGNPPPPTVARPFVITPVEAAPPVARPTVPVTNAATLVPATAPVPVAAAPPDDAPPSAAPLNAVADVRPPQTQLEFARAFAVVFACDTAAGLPAVSPPVMSPAESTATVAPADPTSPSAPPPTPVAELLAALPPATAGMIAGGFAALKRAFEPAAEADEGRTSPWAVLGVAAWGAAAAATYAAARRGRHHSLGEELS
jgi:hypothetical protein